MPLREGTALDVLAFDPEAWEATIELRCSGGTYVRTLAADLGTQLGCGAHVRSLRRRAVGSLGEADAVALDALERLDADARRARVLPMAAALRDLAAVQVSDEDLGKVSPYLTPDVRAVLTVEGALAARKGFGGTAPERVAEQMTALRSTVDNGAAWAAAGGA